MKKLAIAALSASILTSNAYAKVLATYSGGDVTEEQIMKEIKPSLDANPNSKVKKFSDLDKKMQEALVKAYISKSLLEKEASKSGIASSTDFKKKLQTVEKQMVQKEFMDRHIKKTVTDKKVDAEYEKMKKELKGKKEVKVQHILVKTEEEAKKLKKELSGGAKFADLAKKHSLDPGSKESGGEIGYFRRGQMVPAFENKAFEMKKGQVSVPVKSQFGWHIIKKVDERDVKVPAKEEAKPMLKEKLSREAAMQYMEELSKKANVTMKM